MKHPTALLAALAAAAALTACGKQADEDLNAGQRTDGAVSEARDTADGTRREARQATGDMTITAKVNAALVADDQLKSTQINIDTRDGQVTLTGQAPDAQSRERATTLASAVDGVKQVNNQLVVSQG